MLAALQRQNSQQRSRFGAMLNWSMPKRVALQRIAATVIAVLLMSWLRIRPIGIFFLVLFCFWFYKLQFGCASTRYSFRVEPQPELQKRMEHFIERMHDMRQTKPTMFCAISSICLGGLAIVGHLISGSTVVLVGLVLAAIVSTKYNFKIIKLEAKDFAWSEKLSPADAELDDEFMPEVNETNLFVLERAGDLASITSPTDDGEAGEDEEKSDEIPSELLIPDTLPEIDENSTEEEDDLVPLVKKDKHAQASNSGTTAKSDAPPKADATMEFKRGHFKRDSSLSTTSSSSEESLSKGLQFPDHTTVDGPTSLRKLPSAAAGPHSQEATDIVALAVKSQTQALLANSGKILPSLVSGIVQWSMGGGGAALVPAQTQQRVVTALDSSDESDFEILENEDFK